jgi:endonuclease/exonuclease/phosphatase family metal-dependent hydrolase
VPEEFFAVSAPAVRRSAPTALPGAHSWIVLSVVGLLAWALVATSTVDPSPGDSADLRLTATDAQRGRATKFHVASFNVLGYNHTVKGGDAKGFASGIKRTEYAYRILKKHHVNVVGFQELQPQQYEKFNKLTGKRWSLYPGDRLERIAMHNSIAWKTKKWKRVDADYLTIPYFDGEPVKMPVVTLRNRKSGRLVAFANFHNPADSFGKAQKWRDRARRKEIALANRKADQGVPLVITGDMNERDKYFCNMVAKAPMRAANGGSHRKGKGCDTPEPMGIDWIFGSRYIDFAGYKKIETRLVRKTTDHPFVVTRATIPAR